MTTSLLSVIDHLSSVRVLVVGDVMLDRFQYGKVLPSRSAVPHGN